MKWVKSSRKLVELFERIVPEAAGVEKRKMFGYPCSFVNGNMFMGLHQENMILRLSKQDKEDFLKLEQAQQFEPMPGRTMKEYVVVPTYLIENNAVLNKWIKKSLVYVSNFPPKEKKRKKR